MNRSNGTRISKRADRTKAPGQNANLGAKLTLPFKFIEKIYHKALDIIGVSGYHKTSFNYSISWRLMLSFLAVYLVSNFFLLPYIYIFTYKIFSVGTEELIDFVIAELIPVFLVGSIYALRVRQGTLKNYWRKTGDWLVRWARAFGHDLFHHFGFLLATAVILIVTQVYIRQGVDWLLYGNMPMKSSQNNADVMEAVKQNILFLIVTNLVAPVAEELFFRLWLVKMLRHLFVKWGYKWFPHFRVYDGLAIFLSAVVFASFHEPGDSSLFLLSGYISSALILQWVRRTTHSLTAPVWVHSISNLLITTATLL